MKRITKAALMLLSLLLVITLAFGPVDAQAATPKLSAKSITVGVNKSKRLTVKNYSKKVTWTTSSSKIATVTSKGKVTGKKVGSTKITAKAGSKKLTCKVKVVESLNKTSATLTAGKTLKLKVYGTSKTVEWSSDNKLVATVTEKGVVTAVKPGTAVITAAFGTKKLTCKVTVSGFAVNITNKKKEIIDAVNDEGAYELLKTTSKKLTVTGSISGGKAKYIKYTLKNAEGETIDSGKLKGASTFSLSITPDVGSNVLTISATSTKSKKATTTLYVVRDTKTITHDDKVQEGSAASTENFTQNLISVDTTTDENGVTHNKITVSKNSEIYQNYINGDYNPGDVIQLPPTEDLPTGFTGEIESVESKSSDQAVITTTTPDAQEIYGESGSVTLSEIDTDDPVAFIYTADGTDALNPDSTLTTMADDNYSSSILPEGIKKANFGVDVKATKDGFSLSLNLNKLVLYDKDKKKDTKDQLTLSGTVGITDFAVEQHFDWEDWSFNQFYFNKHYTETTSLTLATNMGSADLKDFQKNWTNNWKNTSNTKILGLQASGVDMSSRCPLFYIGIRLKGGTKLDFGNGMEIGKYAEDNNSLIIVVAVYMDLSGTVSADGNLKFEYSAYHTSVTNVLKTTVKNAAYGSEDKYTETKTVGKYQIKSFDDTRQSETNYNDPEHKVTMTLEGTASAQAGLGIFGGVMIDGFIPADVYADILTSVSGSLKGQLTWSPESKDEDYLDFKGTASLDVASNIDYGAQVHFSLETAEEDTDKDAFPISIDADLSGKIELLKFHFQLPFPNLKGNIFGYPEATAAEAEALEGALVYVYSEKNLSIQNDPAYTAAEDKTTYLPTEEYLKNKEEDYCAETKAGGGYEIDHLPAGVYYMEVVKDGYATDIERLDIQEDTTKDATLKHNREENWLDVCQPYEYGGSGHVLCMGDSPEYLTISGLKYYVGFSLCGGDRGSIGSSSAYFNLGGKYNKLEVRIGHIDTSYGTTAKLEVYLDGADEPNQTIDLSCKTASDVYTIELNKAQTAVFKVTKVDGYANFNSCWYGFVDGKWYTDTGVAGTLNPYDQYADMDTEGKSFMDICAPFFGESLTKYNNVEGKSFTVAGVQHNVGFVLSTQSIVSIFGNYAVFFPRGHFNQLTITIGKCDGRDLKTSLYVDLDGVRDESQTVELNPSAGFQTVTIDLKGANSLTLWVKNVHDNWATEAFAFYDGQWS